MVTERGKIRQTVKERRRTYYKLHPSQDRYPGLVITMPNLPDDEYHWQVWQEKGYKATPQELMPNKKLSNSSGDWRFDVTPDEVKEQKVVCDICGQECVSDFGLQAHKRTHEKKKNP